MRIVLNSVTLDLLEDRAVFLPNQSLLVLADVHLGKATGFQTSGINIPEGDNVRDLNRIDQLIEKTKCQQIIIAGDFLHTPSGVSKELTDLVDTWVTHSDAQILLVAGNHDRRALRRKPGINLEITDRFENEALEIVHDPKDAGATKLTICGHVHPAVRINRLKLRSACFHVSANCLTLPAFGSFTGSQLVRPEPDDRIFVSTGKRIAEVPVDYVS